jgi:hypothetical protein
MCINVREGVLGMDGTIPNDGSNQRNSYGKSNGKSADDAQWFSAAAHALYHQKPGTIIFLITGLGDERLCQRYAAGHIRPPAYFLRALLRGAHGRQWINATMEGSTAEWWLEHLDALKLKRVIDNR